jgi:drug/metabolite transporter (DMT)-like permease
LLGESLSSIQIYGMILLLIGTYILEMKPKQALLDPVKIFSNSKFHHYIGFAILLFTASSILDKLLLGKYKLPPITFMAFQQLFFALIFFVIFLFSAKKEIKNITIINRKLLLWILLIAVLTTGYRYTQIEAIKIAPVALVLSVKRISVFISATAGGKIFKETSLTTKIIAALIMVIGAIMIMED